MLEGPRSPAAERGIAGPRGVWIGDPCVDRVATYLGGNRSRAEEVLETLIETAYGKLSSCIGRYPRLAPYLEQAVRGFGSTRLRCITLSEENANDYGAESDTRGGIAFYSYVLGAVAAGPGSSHSWKYVDTKGKVLTKTLTYAAMVEMMMHEVLHSTDVNNRADHAMIEKVEPTAKDPCADNLVMDRVSMVASLCAGGVYMEFDIAAELLLKRMNSCGRQRGCEDVFSGAASQTEALKDQGIPTAEHLSREEARDLCADIRSKAHCSAILQERGRQVTRDSPYLVRLEPELRAKMEQVLPRSTNHIPAALIAGSADARKVLQWAPQSACFRALFKPAPDGGWLAMNKGTPRERISMESWLGGGLDAHLTRISDDSVTAFRKHPYCQGAKTSREIVEWVREVYNAWFLVSEQSYFKGILERVLRSGEDGLYPQSPDPSTDFLEGRLAHLIGPELLRRYLAALWRGHYRSPGFDCRAHGLSYAAPGP